jgi:hypothetical protein
MANKRGKSSTRQRDSKGRFTAKGWGGGMDMGNIWTPISGGNRGFSMSSDVYGGQPAPGNLDLLAAYEDVVFSVVNLIANNVASVDYKLCATTRRGEAQPKCLTKSLDYATRPAPG